MATPPPPFLLSPSLPSVMHFTDTRCIYVCCETAMRSLAFGDTSDVFVVEHHLLSFVPSSLFCYFVMELSIGDELFYTKSIELRVPTKMVGLWHDGYVELEYDQGRLQAVNLRCPMDSVCFGIGSLDCPLPSLLIPAIGISLKALLDLFVDGSPIRGRSSTQMPSHSPSRGCIG